MWVKAEALTLWAARASRSGKDDAGAGPATATVFERVKHPGAIVGDEREDRPFRVIA